MSKHKENPKHKSPAKRQISGALDDKDIERVTGGDKALKVTHKDETPKEAVTFTFGSPHYKYTEQ